MVTTVRLVVFKRSQQSKIQRFIDKQQPILLDDCEINKARRGPRMEIKLGRLINTHTISVQPGSALD